jgi:hypothetical protein
LLGSKYLIVHSRYLQVLSIQQCPSHQTNDKLINFSERRTSSKKKARKIRSSVKARAKTIRCLNIRQQNGLRDLRRGYRRDTNIISRIIALEKRLEHPPSILDLFCAGFTPSEIHSVNCWLVWLYGANWAYETSIPVPGPDIATYDVGVAAA